MFVVPDTARYESDPQPPILAVRNDLDPCSQRKRWSLALAIGGHSLGRLPAAVLEGGWLGSTRAQRENFLLTPPSIRALARSSLFFTLVHAVYSARPTHGPFSVRPALSVAAVLSAAIACWASPTRLVHIHPGWSYPLVPVGSTLTSCVSRT